MGQNPRRPGFRLRWGDGERSEADESAASEAAVEQDAAAPEAPDTEATTAADATADAADPVTTPAAEEEMPFLRDLVGAMRGVAESSRDSSLEGVRQAVEQRVAELTTAAAERTEELRRSADLDVNGIGDWERSEIERIRREAEQRREARRAELEQQLADHQAATDREVEATRGRLADHERELDAFFAQLSEITDPSAFVAAAKRMPPPPDLSKPASTRQQAAAPTPATGEQKSATNGSPAPGPSDESLAARLAQLDQRLAGSQPSDATETAEAEPAAKEQPAAEATTPAAQAAPAAAATAPPAAGGAATAVETSTAIVVKGLGSFGAITSFKQALERVDGIRGVTLSLGPTGDFVYRASHAADFDILGAIRTIEGPNTGIEQSDGSVVVTIARPR